MRELRSLLAVSLLVMTACSILTSLDDLRGDGGAADASGDGPVVVPACPTLDASACVDAAIPNGWTYTLFTPTDQTCPSADYVKTAYLSGLKIDPNACTCGCKPNGSYSCNGTVDLGTSINCSNVIAFDASSATTCVPISAGTFHLGFGPLPDAGGAACTASVTGNGLWSAENATACSPDCNADYCGAAAPFRRCILSTTSTTCPAPFVATTTAGAATGVGVRCAACECRVDPASCGASVKTFADVKCTALLSDADVPTDGTCNVFATTIQSIRYTPIIPSPTCSITDGGAGSAAFAQPVTVCCLP